jgi:hypothetical protein
MLRITPVQTLQAATLKLEGQLSGPWVEELRRCWASLAEDKVPVRINLRHVTFVDGPGRDLLLLMERQGTPFLDCSEFLRDLLHLDGRQQSKRRPKSVKKERSHVRTLRS